MNAGALISAHVLDALLAQQVHINQHRESQVVIFVREELVRIRPLLHFAQIATLGQSLPTGQAHALSVLLVNSILRMDALYQPADAKSVLQEHSRREVAWGTQVAVYRARPAPLRWRLLPPARNVSLENRQAYQTDQILMFVRTV
jgi:hypothetical protein